MGWRVGRSLHSPRSFILCPTVSVEDRPADLAALEIHPDSVAVVAQPLAINHLAAHGVVIKWSEPYHLPGFPTGSRENAGAMETNVICERFLNSVGVGILTVRGCEMHYNDDGEPPFHSALETKVHRHGLVPGRRMVCLLAGAGLIRGA